MTEIYLTTSLSTHNGDNTPQKYNPESKSKQHCPVDTNTPLLMKKFPAFYLTRSFTAVLKTVRYYTPS